jgi:hypothetical protein
VSRASREGEEDEVLDEKEHFDSKGAHGQNERGESLSLRSKSRENCSFEVEETSTRSLNRGNLQRSV